jgi:hypothetical protein
MLTDFAETAIDKDEPIGTKESLLSLIAQNPDAAGQLIMMLGDQAADNSYCKDFISYLQYEASEGYPSNNICITYGMTFRDGQVLFVGMKAELTGRQQRLTAVARLGLKNTEIVILDSSEHCKQWVGENGRH